MTSFPTHRRTFFHSQVSTPKARWIASFGTFAVFGCLLLTGCKKEESKAEPGPAAKAAPNQAKESPPDAVGPRPSAPPATEGSTTPVGPPMVIVPGKGVNAIRMGTNLANLERHMEAPCDIRLGDEGAETKCIYVDQAAEFTLREGLVTGMKFHRRGRLVAAPGKEKRYFGSFNGGMRPEIMFGLYQHILEKEYGEPLKKEPLMGPDGQVDRRLYAGVAFEYDLLKNGNLVLSGIEVLPESTK